MDGRAPSGQSERVVRKFLPGSFSHRRSFDLPWGTAALEVHQPSRLRQVIDLLCLIDLDTRMFVVRVTPLDAAAWSQDFESEAEALAYVESLRLRSTPSG